MPEPRKRRSEDLDFQMVFFEGILKMRPDFVEALIALGEIYTKKGLYDKGLKVDQRLSSLRPDNPIVHYNLACSHSLLGELTPSLEALTRAIDLGYDDLAFMSNDPDLANVRRDERFGRLVKKVKKSSSRVLDAKRIRL